MSLGARCALHPDQGATATCRRCGSFMCAGCSLDGATPLCPRCRELAGEATFPFDASADVGTLWGHAQAAWTGNLLVLTLASLAFIALTMAGSLAAAVLSAVLGLVVRLASGEEPGTLQTVALFGVSQTLGLLVGAAVQAVALTGFFRVLVDALQGRRADLGRMFSQLHLAPRMLALQFLLTLLVLGPLVVVLLAAGGYAAAQGAFPETVEPAELARLLPRLVGALLFATLAALPLVVALLPVSLFAVPELLVGDCGPLEAIARAWRLGSGQRLRLIGYSFLSALVMLVGALACLVGVVPALPLAYLLLLALFLALRRSAGLPAAGP